MIGQESIVWKYKINILTKLVILLNIKTKIKNQRTQIT